ncbi:hypothetical protein BaRGS_00030110 [Batillaria attramentaria]|uniref:G-protein coupled receptors family 1 profile domain-containing protein n=1 Tax=Batillaria attramentaria TaxID=370345 RepID=A0ABD0JUI2_9CAEN
MHMGPACTNVTVTDSELQDLKEEDARALDNLNLPIVVILSVVSTVGIPSNVISIIVWSTDRSLNCSIRFYVVAIAAYDLLACLVGIPAELVEFYFIVRTRDPLLCKLSKFILTVAHVGSMHGLLCIALDRYQHIVHPMKFKTIRQRRKLLLAVGFAVAVMVASPNLFFYGVHTMKPKNIPEYTCGVSDAHKTSALPAVMKVELVTVFGAAWFAVAYMYRTIIKQLWRHQYTLESMRSTPNIPLASASAVSVPCKVESVAHVCPELPSGAQSVCKSPQDSGIRSDVDVNNSADTQLAKDSGDPQPTTSASAHTASNRKLCRPNFEIPETPVPFRKFLGGVSQKAACGTRQTAGGPKLDKLLSNPIRTDQSAHLLPAGMDSKAIDFMVTVTMLTVTCVFFVSYCPYLVVLLLAASDEFFLTNVRCNEARYFAFHLLSRSYIMILALNPLIYCAVSPPFRRQCKRLLRCKDERDPQGVSASRSTSVTKNPESEV